MNRLVPILLVLALAGLILIQYRYLVIGLRLEKTAFDREMEGAIDQMRENFGRKNNLTFFLATVLRSDQSVFSVGMDTLHSAAEGFLEDFLRDRLDRNGLPVEFSFALADEEKDLIFVQSKDFGNTTTHIGRYTIRLQGALMSQCGCKPLLYLHIHQLTPYLLSQLNGITIPSLLLLLVILFCFGWYIRMNQQQKKLNEIKNEFINNLTHELKTPVFSIALASKLLWERLPAEHQPLLQMITHENDRLKIHIDKVLDLATIENERHVIKKELCHIHALIRQLAEVAEQRLLQVGGVWALHLQAEQDEVWADASHLRNAIDNLIDNAIKYGGSPPIVSLTTTWQDGKIHICVADQGIGMAENELSRIFDKFYRIQHGDLHPVKGFGLGLSYVRQVAKTHQGSIQVESTLHEGSRFTLILPTRNQS